MATAHARAALVTRLLSFHATRIFCQNARQHMIVNVNKRDAMITWGFTCYFEHKLTHTLDVWRLKSAKDPVHDSTLIPRRRNSKRNMAADAHARAKCPSHHLVSLRAIRISFQNARKYTIANLNKCNVTIIWNFICHSWGKLINLIQWWLKSVKNLVKTQHRF